MLDWHIGHASWCLLIRSSHRSPRDRLSHPIRKGGGRPQPFAEQIRLVRAIDASAWRRHVNGVWVVTTHHSRCLSISIRLSFDSGVLKRTCSINVSCLGFRGLATALAAASFHVLNRLRARVPVLSFQYLRFSSSLCRLRSSALYAS